MNIRHIDKRGTMIRIHYTEKDCVKEQVSLAIWEKTCDVMCELKIAILKYDDLTMHHIQLLVAKNLFHKIA